MNSLLATSINGGANNQQVANRSSSSASSVLSSSIEFTLTGTMTNSPSTPLGKNMIRLTSKEELSFNGQNKMKNCDQNRNLIENYMNINGTKEKSAEDGIPVPKVQLYTGKINSEWKVKFNIGAGLENAGNTCFMNTVIQCLTYCPPLANYLLADSDHLSKCTITGFCMMCILQKHVKKAVRFPGVSFKPSEFISRLKSIAKHFVPGRQEDAHEFLRYVIEHLCKSCLAQTNGVLKLDPASKETTIINQIFGGYLRSQVTCGRCKKESNTYDHFMDFILDIKNVTSLENALDEFTQTDYLQQENCYKCPKCKMKVEAQRKVSVYREPIVATFQLKRFDFNRSFGNKIVKHITFPETLNLRPYMCDTKGDRILYRLFAVLVHYGNSCNSGHYFCYIRNPQGFWFEMNDERVQKVSINKVRQDQNAYVLFYVRTENPDKASSKNCLDNSPVFKKGPDPNSQYFKVAEMNKLKMAASSVRVEPFSNSKPFNSPNSVKKFNAPDREKISFGFRTNTSSTTVASPKSKSVSSESLPSLNGGLVPYIQDSSESSNEAESSPSWSTQNSSTDRSTKNLAKNGSPVNNKTSSHLETQPKLSMPVFSIPPPSPSSRSSPKVSATGSWIVTESPPVSSSPSLNRNGVNSTTNWHVIEASDLGVNSSPRVVEDFIRKDVPDSPKKSVFEPVSENPNEILTKSPSFRLKQTDNNQINSSAQKSVFRQQTNESETCSPEENETNNSVKRKYSHLFSSCLQDSSNFDNDKSRLSPSTKKLKHAENSSFLNSHNDSRTSNYFSNKFDDVSSVVQHRQFSNSNCNNSTMTNGVLNSVDNNRIPMNVNSGGTECTNEESMKNDRFSRGKQQSSPMKPFNSSQRDKEKNSIFDQGRNASLYGTAVPTWRSEKHHRPTSVSGHEVRRSFDAYDEDFDRGKIRKSRPQDHYKFPHQKNLFQKYSDNRYQGKYNHNGKFFRNHDHRKYDSNRCWKDHHSNYRRRQNHYRRY